MNNKKLIKMMVVLLLLSFMVGCGPLETEGITSDKKIEGPKNKTEKPLKVKYKYPLKDGGTLLFKSDETEWKKEIAIRSEDGERVICDKRPSVPVVSPEGTKFAFIDVLVWEGIGEVYLYDVTHRKSEVIIERNIDFEEQQKPKKLVWLDNTRLMVIIGHAYGTVSIGGDLYIYDVNEETLSLAIEPEDSDEIKDIRTDGNEVTLDYVRFNEAMTDYTVESQVYSKEDILNLIKE